MTRTYERDNVRWDADTLKELERQGKAQYFPGLPGYVVTLDEGGKVAVRNSQIIDAQAVRQAAAVEAVQAVKASEPELQKTNPFEFAHKAHERMEQNLSREQAVRMAQAMRAPTDEEVAVAKVNQEANEARMAAYEGAKKLAKDYVRICKRPNVNIDSLVRRILTDEDDDLALRLRESIAAEQSYQQQSQTTRSLRAEGDDLIAFFTK
jgi:hypothetical protein